MQAKVVEHSDEKFNYIAYYNIRSSYLYSLTENVVYSVLLNIRCYLGYCYTFSHDYKRASTTALFIFKLSNTCRMYINWVFEEGMKVQNNLSTLLMTSVLDGGIGNVAIYVNVYIAVDV